MPPPVEASAAVGLTGKRDALVALPASLSRQIVSGDPIA
jgi:hypothetical protein